MERFKKIVIRSLILSLMVILSVKVYYKLPKVSTYSIQDEPTWLDKKLDRLLKIKDDNRKHAIIQIVGETGTCTAFVVNDTTAITAAHCMKMDEQTIKVEIPKLLEKFVDFEAKSNEYIAYLRDTCDPRDIKCLTALEQAILSLKTAMEEKAKTLAMKPDTYSVIDVDGVDTELKVTAYSRDKRRDFGFIRGDFKNFKKLYIKPGWDVKPGDTLRACGFFGSVLPPSCVDFKAIGIHGFAYACEGILVPGVSGGPVFDEDGYVVGIAVAALEDVVLMTPTIGIINILTDKEVKKLEDSKKNKKK